MPTTLDLRSLACPGPVIELRKRMDQGATVVRMHVADEHTCSNLTRFATSRGAQVDVQPHQGGFLISVTAAAGVARHGPAAGEDAEPGCSPTTSPPNPSTVVQLSGDTMGSGDDDLGALLLRGFIKTLTRIEPTPSVVVCYNGAVKLCCEGSPSLEDLRLLEAAGASVLACGTCLGFYDLGERLAAGRVTDMLEIVTLLSQADRVIRP
jgi:selenium metabolism protein YedF